MSPVSSSSKPAGGWQPPTLEEMQAMLPQYQFEALLGRGGMGAVYKALQVTLDRKVAIKVLPVDLVENGDTQFAERFKNEARTMAKMNHPSIVKVFDFGETNTGLLYIVMEFIDGTDVSKMIASQGKLPEDYALSITAHVSDALAYAHKNGIIHRDIKPANILINMEGAVKVADFGLAKANDPGQSGITKTNMAMGTPDFVAPEAFIPGIPLDGRADLYAMGVMLYQMLTGEIPRGVWTLPGKKLGTDPRFDAIITKAMQTDREERYQSAAELRRDLDTILTLPRAALAAKQQAAAQTAPKQAASGSQRRPVSAPLEEVPAPVKKTSMVGPVMGVATSIILIIGLAYVLRGPEPRETQVQAEVEEARPAPAPPTVEPSPAPSTPVTTRADDETWVDGLSYIFADSQQSLRIRRQPDGAALSIASTDLWPVAIDGAPMVDQAVRLTTHLDEHGFNLSLRRTKNRPDAVGAGYELKWMPAAEELVVGRVVPDRSFTALHSWSLPAGIDRDVSHRLEFRAVGDRLSVSLDDRKLGEFRNSDVARGFPHLRVFKDSVIERFDYADLGGTSALPQVPVASSSPQVMPPAPVAPSKTTPEVRPAIPSGWTDLLAEVEVKRDAVNGLWEMTPEGLTVKREHGVRALEFNRDAPEEYDFEIEFTVTDGYSDVGQLLSVAGRTLRWKMAQGMGEFYSFGPMLDGKKPDDPERTEAVVKRKRLKIGQRYRSTVEVRRDSLRALLDGEEVLQWSGDFQRMSDENSSTARNSRHLGLTCYATAVTFHQAVMRPLTSRVPVQTPAMRPVATTTTVAPVSAPPADPHLAKLEAGFTARYQSDVQKPFLDAVTALNKSYLANGVAKARAAAQSRGNLKEVIAFDEVKARIERGEGVPEVDEPGTPESLKSLRSIYRNALAKITAERDARAAPLYAIYVRALDAYIGELNKASKVNEAAQVKELRSKIAAQKPATAVVAEAPEPALPPSSTGGTPSPSTSAKPQSSGSSWRTAADFLVANGGSFVADKNGAATSVSTLGEIPAGRFDILEIMLNRDGSVLPPLKDADFAAFAGLRDLRRVHIRPSNPGLSDAAFAFLSFNSDLTWVNLDGVPDVTDAVLVHLAGARKLDYLSIQNASQFTGRGLDRLSCTASLTTLELIGCGLTDDGIRALAAFKKLQTLHVNSISVTDAGFAALADVPSLNALNLTGTALGDESAGSLAKLTRLASLDLSSTKITDLGLKKLLPLKKLTSLRLNGTAVTLEAAAEFQKQMPQCKVSR